MATKIQLRRDSTTNWSTLNPVLASGELGLNTTLSQFKIGNGSTAWNSLSYWPSNAPAGSIVGTTDTQTLTNKTLTAPAVTGLTETPYAINDGPSVVLNPSNGGIQTWVLGASRTPTASFLAGQAMTLMVLDGTGYTLTWSSLPVTWVGGIAPTLDTTKRTIIELWKVETTIYGSSPGAA